MKITHYLARFRLEDGGVVRAVLDMCTGAAGLGHEVTILTWDDTDIPNQWPRGDTGGGGGDGNLPRVARFDPPRGRFMPKLRRSAITRVDAVLLETDVLHLHTPWDPLCAEIAFRARPRGVPYTISVHGMLDDWCMDQKTLKKKLYLSMRGRAMLEQAGAVHCTAQAEAEQSSKWFPRGRAAIVPLIFDLEPFRELPGPDLARQKFPEAFDGRPTALFLSRLHHKKGLELLIDAAAMLRNQNRDLAVLIAGTGDEKYEAALRQRTRENNLQDIVHFLGFVAGREKVSLYEASDIFVLPTNQENWGFVLFETLACGTPLITTRGVDTWPELQGSGGAEIVDSNAPAVADAMIALFDDDARRARMGEAGRAWVFDNLNIEHVVGRYEELYAQLMEGRPA